MICVPSAITEVERRAVTEAARRAGAADAQLLEQPMAAAIGAGLPIHEPVGNMVIDVGGGTSETALISLGGVVALNAVRVGSFDIDAAIQTWIRREYGIAVGERTAEEIKIAIGSAWPTVDEFKAEVRGRDLMSGLPEERDPLARGGPRGHRRGRRRRSSTPSCTASARRRPSWPRTSSSGACTSSAAAGCCAASTCASPSETEIPVHLVDAPLECVVLGAGRVIESYDRLKTVAGKSTFIKILSGVYVHDEGELLVEETRFNSPRAAKERGIATVFQDLATVPLMSIWRNFFLGSEPTVGLGPLRRLDIRAAKKVMREELEKMGIDVRDPDQPVGTLSGGERQAVAIARALHFGAKVLILDEPTSALGVKQSGIVLRYIAAARDRGVGVIFISHNPHHAYPVGDHFVILNRGRLRARGNAVRSAARARPDDGRRRGAGSADARAEPGQAGRAGHPVTTTQATSASER